MWAVRRPPDTDGGCINIFY